MKVRDILGRLLGGVMVVALALFLVMLFSSVSKKEEPVVQAKVTPGLTPTGTFIVPTPVPIPTYTPVPTLPPGEFVITRVIPLPPEMGFFGWSPDGERILLGKWLEYYLELWAANYDGSGIVKIASKANMPAWSPDGQYVTYAVPREPYELSGEIWVVDTRDLTSRMLAEGDVLPLQWLPSGEVAFLRGGNVWAVGRDGGQERQVSNMASLAVSTDSRYGYQVSPDGERVAFYYTVSDPETGWIDYMWIAGLDGSNPVLVNDRGVLHSLPVWAPDSSKVAWASSDHHQSGSARIWVVNADGLGKREIYAGFPRNVCWSPDGRVLAFSDGFREGESTIRLINVDGTDLRVLDTSLEDAYNPFWSPDGKKIVFYRILYKGEPGQPIPPDVEIGQYIVAEVARR